MSVSLVRIATARLSLCRFCGCLRPSFRTVNNWSSLSPAARVQEQSVFLTRWLRTGSVFQATSGEKRITALLTEKLHPTYIEVSDISGGCGSMYAIVIDSELFKGKRPVQQNRMVHEALGEELKGLHGVAIRIGNPT